MNSITIDDALRLGSITEREAKKLRAMTPETVAWLLRVLVQEGRDAFKEELAQVL